MADRSANLGDAHGDWNYCFKYKKDELRDFVAQSFNFDNATKDTVAAIYSTTAEFQAVTAADSATFLGAVQRLSPPTSITSEPISTVFHKFDEDVDLVHAAAGVAGRPMAAPEPVAQHSDHLLGLCDLVDHRRAARRDLRHL